MNCRAVLQKTVQRSEVNLTICKPNTERVCNEISILTVNYIRIINHCVRHKSDTVNLG